MDECKMIHETIIRDVIDLVHGLKDFNPLTAINSRKQSKSFRSIAAATQNLTLVFPCIASRPMSIETASMYSKAIERKAVSMLQMLFSALSITNAEDGIAYLRNFHTNLNLDNSMTVDKFINMMDNLVVEGVIQVDNEEIYRKYSRDLKNLSYYLPSSIQESTSLSDYTVCKEPYMLEESYILDESKYDIYDDELDYLDSIIDTEEASDKKKKKKKESVKEFYNPLNTVGVQRVTIHGVPYDDIKYSRSPQYAHMIDVLDRKAMFAMNKANKNETESLKEFLNPLNTVGQKRVTSHGVVYDDKLYGKDPEYSTMIDQMDRDAMFGKNNANNTEETELNEFYNPLNSVGLARTTLHGVPYDDKKYGRDPYYSIDIDRKDRMAMYKMANAANTVVKEGVTPNGVRYNDAEYNKNPNYALKVDQLDLQISKGNIDISRNLYGDNYRQQQDDKNFNYKQQQDNIRSSQSDRSFDQQVRQNDISNKNQRDNLALQKAKFNNDINKDRRDYNHKLDREKIDDDRYDKSQEYREKRDQRDDEKFSDKMALDRDRFNADKVRNNIDYLKNQLLDNDVKKPNELVPTTMIVNYISKGEDGRPIQAQTVIGVKAKLYPVNSDDIMKRIAIKHTDKNWLVGLIKSSTREISFLRDFLFAVDQAKLDALSQSRKGSSSKLWKVLERRGIKSRFKRAIGANNDASAITSLAITQEEVEYLKKMYDIDVENPKVIRPIMESYNLMAFCIFDEVNEVGKFIFDTGDDIYEEMSFRALEREDKGNDYKKIINLMSKMR